MSSSVEPVNEVYESIGRQILSGWDSDNGSLPGSLLSDNLLTRLDRLLCCSPDAITNEWRTEMHGILQNLTAADFATHGKRIALFLLQATEQTEHTIEFAPSIRMDGEPVSEIRSSPDLCQDSARGSRGVLYSHFPHWLPTIPYGKA
jgi:hypothetical protein